LRVVADLPLPEKQSAAFSVTYSPTEFSNASLYFQARVARDSSDTVDGGSEYPDPMPRGRDLLYQVNAATPLQSFAPPIHDIRGTLVVIRQVH
jgi:hypothetical protein